MMRVEEVSIEEILKESYLTYAMSVIVSRALPDVRDGLKPVHRRILYAMYELGNFHNKPYKKSARVVGEVLGKYHPHGDSAIYDSLVRMAQPFSLRYLLVDGQGNFGSIDGDNAAAMRYTEVRMTKLAEEMLRDIEYETVEFRPNFDNTLKEPSVLPSVIPNLLINGASGIAVGMATNIPPHNLREVIDGLIAIIEGRDIEGIIKGPDFPTGGIILGREGIIKAYREGKGIIKIRARTKIEGDKIYVTEIPYMVNKTKIIEDIVNAVKNKKIENIADLHDRSDKRGLLIEIKLKKGSNAEVVLNKLFHYTSLEVSFGIMNIALVDGVPKLLSLESMLREFIKFRFEVIRKRTVYLKRKAEERRHLLIGLLKALEKLDDTVELIRKSKDYEGAKNGLIEMLGIDEIQAKAILEMRLNKLITSEREKLENEKKELDKKIEDYEDILSRDERVYEIMKKEFIEIKEKYGDERKTEILEYYDERSIEDLIPNKEMLIVYSKEGYVKRVSPEEFRTQHRGGKGVMLTGDLTIAAMNHDYVFMFSNKGRVYSLKAYEIQKGSRGSKGKHVRTMLKMDDKEEIVSMLSLKDLKGYFVFITKKGLVKRTKAELYKNAKKSGVIAINLRGEDKLVSVKATSGEENIFVSTKRGYSIMFNEKEVRETGRNSQGVKAIELREGDEVVSFIIAKKRFVLIITSKGYGKLVEVESFKTQHRGGKGMITIKTNESRGYLRFTASVEEEDEVVLLSSKGKLVRIKVKDISKQSRYAMGVRLIKLEEDEVESIAVL